MASLLKLLKLQGGEYLWPQPWGIIMALIQSNVGNISGPRHLPKSPELAGSKPSRKVFFSLSAVAYILLFLDRPGITWAFEKPAKSFF